MNYERDLLQRLGLRWQIEDDVLSIPRSSVLRMDFNLGTEVIGLKVVLLKPFGEDAALDAAAAELHAHIMERLDPQGQRHAAPQGLGKSWSEAVARSPIARSASLARQRPTAPAAPKTHGSKPPRKPLPNRRPTKKSGQRRG